jgi:NADH-quinone oxidoreductase subunit H
MNFAWKFMLPMAFTCLVAAAVWHYTGRGLRGWLWSAAIVAAVYFTLSILLFVYIWLRGTLPRTRVDQIMNFAWKFMLPMAFTCLVAAAVWHYTGRGLRGWLWSAAIVAAVYFTLSILLETKKKFAPRTYRFAE